MPITDSLIVSLIARNERFSRSVKQAEGQLESFRNTTRVVSRAAAGFFGGLAAALSVRAISNFVQTTARAVDETSQFSQRLGIGVQQLQAMQFAGRLTGVSTQALNVGLQRMTRRTAEAALGIGEARAAIAELGLDAKSLAALSPDQQFLRIAKAAEQFNNQGDRVRLFFKVFDTEGVELVNTARLLKDGLEDVFQEAQRRGLILGPEQVTSAQAIADAFTRLRATTSGIAQQALPFMQSGIQGLLDSTDRWVASMGGARQLGRDLGETLNAALNISGSLFDKMSDTLNVSQKTADQLSQSLSGAAGSKDTLERIAISRLSFKERLAADVLRFARGQEFQGHTIPQPETLRFLLGESSRQDLADLSAARQRREQALIGSPPPAPTGPAGDPRTELMVDLLSQIRDSIQRNRGLN